LDFAPAGDQYGCFFSNAWVTAVADGIITRASNGEVILDLDGDGIPYRTVPGNLHPRSGYFTRGTGHNEFAKYDEDPENWEK